MEGEFLPLEVRASGIHGTGCYAGCEIPADAVIAEYTGELISRDEAVLREDPASARHSCYVFSIDDEHFIDAKQTGNATRFINHSCSPNCRISRVNGRVYITSVRRIASGEELSYDYSFDGGYRVACLCGSGLCRGYI